MITGQVAVMTRVDGEPFIVTATAHRWDLIDGQEPWAGHVVEVSTAYVQRGGHEGAPRAGTRRGDVARRVARAFDALESVQFATERQAWTAFDEALADLTGRDICERCHVPLTYAESRFTEQRLAHETLCGRCYRGPAA